MIEGYIPKHPESDSQQHRWNHGPFIWSYRTHGLQLLLSCSRSLWCLLYLWRKNLVEQEWGCQQSCECRNTCCLEPGHPRVWNSHSKLLSQFQAKEVLSSSCQEKRTWIPSWLKNRNKKHMDIKTDNQWCKRYEWNTANDTMHQLQKTTPKAGSIYKIQLPLPILIQSN